MPARTPAWRAGMPTPQRQGCRRDRAESVESMPARTPAWRARMPTPQNRGEIHGKIGFSGWREIHGSGRPPEGGGGGGRRCQGRGRASDCRAVDDQYRYGRCHLHCEPGDGAGAGGVGAGAGDRQYRTSGGGGAEDRRDNREVRRARADYRRLSLQRPYPAEEVSGVRAGAGEVPHQPGEFGHRQEDGRQFPHDDRGGHREPQAGAHRGELGLARCGAADAHDGREFEAGRAEGCARGDAGCDGGERAAIGAGGGAARVGARPDHPQRQGERGAGPDRRVPRAGGGGAIIRCTWG